MGCERTIRTTNLKENQLFYKTNKMGKPLAKLTKRAKAKIEIRDVKPAPMKFKQQRELLLRFCKGGLRSFQRLVGFLGKCFR